MRKHHGFTFVELVVVVGVIGVLLSLLAPVVAKVRSSARAAACESNLHQLGAAWTAYMMDNDSALIPYMWHTPGSKQAYDGYWFGILESFGVKGESLLCPAADTPLLIDPAAHREGYGSAGDAWTGRYAPDGTAIRLTKTIYRDGSYGYNRYLTASGWFGNGSGHASLLAIRDMSNVPVFMDCVFADVRPDPIIPGVAPKMPTDLTGMQSTPATPDLWKLLIARHGKAINVCMADGSVRRVALSDIYTLTWKSIWPKTTLSVP
ncbi:MAG TPA: prepilin-type N-terminal cleavage/methylation domain-containing protein [Tepidisphaeraceae bacterium]|nr:prepilin-type N-terminal cleavage/methylation domain-containing protein [Tepidisphaeraceae bacterium]